MFKRFFGLKSLWVVLIFFCVWLWRAWSWQDSFRLPTAEEVVRDFVLLPVLICAALWLLKSTVYLVKSKGTPAVATTHEAVAEQKPESTSDVDILDVELRLPVGNAPDAIVSELIRRIQPGFHNALKTADGLPVRAAWVQNLITADFDAVAPNALRLDADVQRALSLALDALQSVAMRHFQWTDAKADLQIHYLPPTRWDAHTTEAAEHWLVEGLAALLLPSMPFHFSVHPVSCAVDALKYLNKLNIRINNDPDAAAHVLLVSDSFIGNVPVARWDKQGRLYDIEQPEGVIPGEGACALLLGLPPVTHSISSLARVSQVDIRQCDSFANDATHPVSVLFDQRDGMANAVDTVISDASQRASQQAEVAAMQHSFFPGLHPINDSLALSVGCGELAAVAPIAALALAAHLSVCSQKNCLVVSVQDDGWRAATLVLSPSVEAQSAHEESV